MQYLVIFTPNKKFETDGVPSDFAETELKEQAQVRVLYAGGGARQVWALDTKTRGGVILFEAESPEHLQEMIDSFPLIKADYADYQILPLAPHAAFSKKS
ncbi:MAG: muconolactone Delta-isomerase family protein [Nostoc sp.]|uniref:muconolactone Delta-isomerase family protein n=1 Tax=Nostoc sp. TaxID=1180 RepID=UPI002FF52570